MGLMIKTLIYIVLFPIALYIIGYMSYFLFILLLSAYEHFREKYIYKL